MYTQINQNNRKKIMTDQSTALTGVNISEKPAKLLPFWAGPTVIVLNILSIIAAIGVGILAIIAFFSGSIGMGVLYTILCVILAGASIAFGTMTDIIQPGEAIVYSFFGEYVGTVRRSGLVAVLPFLSGTKVSIRNNNFETPVSKVNDANGNPINISAIVVWRLKDSAKAIYAVQDFITYLKTQAEAAVRHVAAAHPYDAGVTPVLGDTLTVDKANEVTKKVSLLEGAEIVNQELFDEIGLRAAAAGVEIVEVRINNLAYSVEIAQAMLQRQQAAAVVDARKIIVEGALGIVEETVSTLNKTTPLGKEEQARLTSNLLVVLVGESKVTPTIDVANR